MKENAHVSVSRTLLSGNTACIVKRAGSQEPGDLGLIYLLPSSEVAAVLFLAAQHVQS